MESTNKVKLFKQTRQQRIRIVLCILILICVLTVFYLNEASLAPDAVPVHPHKKHYYYGNDAGQTDTSDAAPLLERIGLENPYIYDYIRILRKDVEPENLINVKPYKFLPNYRNPCWDEAERLSSNRKKHTPYIRCMPYYYLIGAPKCGTTDLLTRLIRHPEICGNVEKELNWLTRKRFLKWKGEQAQPRLNSYYEQFNNATRRIMAHNNTRDFHSHIVGDHSAATIFDNGYWSFLPEYNHLEEPLYTNSDYIHHINPQAKIIVMVRNPIDRLYSEYLYFNRDRARRALGKLNVRARHSDNQVGPHEFHELVVREIHTFNTCLDKSPLRYCLYTTYLTKNIPKHVTRVRIGLYYHHLHEWYRVFPKEQIKVIKLEDFHNNEASYMAKIFDFLDVAKLSKKQLSMLSNKSMIANSNTQMADDIGKMLPKTRQLLQEFYAPYNEELGQLLGEMFNYNKDDEAAYQMNPETTRTSTPPTTTYIPHVDKGNVWFGKSFAKSFPLWHRVEGVEGNMAIDQHTDNLTMSLITN